MNSLVTRNRLKGISKLLFVETETWTFASKMTTIKWLTCLLAFEHERFPPNKIYNGK